MIRHIIHAPHMAPKVLPPNTTIEVRRETRAATVRPSALTKFKRLVVALKYWNAKGRPIASRETRKARAKACAACEFWEPGGNAGLGQCHAPGCGCSRLKLYLATEICPHPSGSRWPENPVTTTPTPSDHGLLSKSST